MRSLLLGVLLLAATAHAQSPPAVGDSLESFTLASRTGGAYRWKPGKMAVIWFCAFWCDTWKDQLPRVEKAQQSLQGLPIDFLTVSVDGRWSELGKEAAVGESLSDAGNAWTKRIGVDRVPYTLLVDTQGMVRWTAYGVVRSDDLVRAVRQLTTPLQAEAGAPIYLTFDDFPSGIDEELLDILRVHRVPATFFAVCSRLEPVATLERAAKEGHRIEVHAWKHDEISTDLVKSSAALRPYGEASLYRPAGSERILRIPSGEALKVPVVNPYDYKRPGKKELIRRVLYGVKPGAVIQLHVGVRDTLEALPELIAKLKARGFRFELLRG